MKSYILVIMIITLFIGSFFYTFYKQNEAKRNNERPAAISSDNAYSRLSEIGALSTRPKDNYGIGASSWLNGWHEEPDYSILPSSDTEIRLSANFGVSDLRGLKDFRNRIDCLMLSAIDLPIEEMKIIAHLQGLRTLYPPKNISNEGLDLLSKLKVLDYLYLGYSQIDDSGLEILKQFDSIRSIYLGGTNISDSGLTSLKNLGVEELNLDRTSISDKGLEIIASMNSLVILSLNSTNISNASITTISGLQRLEYLSIMSTNVDNESLNALCQLKTLKRLSIINSNINNNSKSIVQKMLKSCEVQ